MYDKRSRFQLRDSSYEPLHLTKVKILLIIMRTKHFEVLQTLKGLSKTGSVSSFNILTKHNTFQQQNHRYLHAISFKHKKPPAYRQMVLYFLFKETVTANLM